MAIVYFWFVLFGAFGLALGSFGNVLIHRIHSNETLFGRSRCALCKKILAWFDLLPILSYVTLRGKCRMCRQKISYQYPLVEAGSMCAFLFALALTPLDPLYAFFSGAILFVLFLTAVYDFKFQQIPDVFTVLLVLLAAVTVVFHRDVASALVGAAIPFAWFGLQWLLSRGRVVGTGDIFLSFAIGLWLGMPDTISFLILSYVAGAVVLLTLLLVQKIPVHTRVPFVPFMLLGVILTLLGAGDMYLSLLR